MNWFENQRLEWIKEILKVFGFINRHHLMTKFGISKPQASKDLNKFMRIYPESMRYDPKDKYYIRILK